MAPVLARAGGVRARARALLGRAAPCSTRRRNRGIPGGMRAPMSEFFVIALSLIVVAVGAVAVVLAARGAGARRQLAQLVEQLAALQRNAEAYQHQVQSMRPQLVAAQAAAQSASLALTTQAQQAQASDQQKEEWLQHLQQENDWLRTELEKRPK